MEEVFSVIPETVNTKRGAASRTPEIWHSMLYPGSFEDMLADEDS